MPSFLISICGNIRISINGKSQMLRKFFQKSSNQVKNLGSKIRTLFLSKVDADALEQLEQLFFEADLGSEISQELQLCVEKLLRKNPEVASETILAEIRQKLLLELRTLPSAQLTTGTPHVILIVGVNGNGKTTTVAKLAKLLQKNGQKVLVAACDTFRAAAGEQLETWAERIGCEIVKGKEKSDPAAVVFDAITAAKARNVDTVLIDTAGRLHTKQDLMRELEKIHRVSQKACPGAPHETLLVLDATIGQNGIEQAKIFHNYTPLTGLVLTKMDGTAKGGTAIAIQKALKLPIQYIGTGESLDDLHPFDPEAFITSLL